ncbi:hypothetical protein [Lactobacillus sp. UCMA15818]|uniref:hypothetical protein n=1 Tax=Lactobacillus sp. UCMA15818 TaxID=2583394 RepID=UPI0025AF33FB|nr:hypothetical protein [Lactobacillus sp. UCMA15818]MDN2452537.1 hypothetical protein [Lactobacillus sp. UCMA15818]
MILVKTKNSWHICYKKGYSLVSNCDDVVAKIKGSSLRNIKTNQRVEFFETDSDSDFVKEHQLCQRCLYLKKKWS